MDNFLDLYKLIQSESTEELQSRTFFKSVEHRYMPLAWYIPFYPQGYTEFHYATHRELLQEPFSKKSLDGDHTTHSYVLILEKYYSVVLGQTAFVDNKLLVYEATQALLVLASEWELTPDAMLERARDIMNVFLNQIGDFLLVKESPEQFYAFILEMEKSFTVLSEKTARRLDEIEMRNEAMDYISNILPGFVEGQELPSDREEYYVFAENEQKRSLISRTFLFILKYQGKIVQASDIMTIFDEMNCYERIPYIVCIDENHKKFIKVYTGKTSEQQVPYNNIVFSKKRGYRPNSIEFTLWLGEGTLETTRKGSFFRVVANFDTGKISLKLPATVSANYKRRMKEALRSLGNQLSVERDRSTAKVFSTETQIQTPLGFQFHEYLFYDLLVSHALFRNCFYSEERVMPASKRKFIKLQYAYYLSRDFRKNTGEPIIPPVSFSLSVRRAADESTKIRLLINNTNDEMIHALIQEFILCMQFYHVGLYWSEYDSEMPESLKTINDINDIYKSSFREIQTAEEELRKDNRGIDRITSEKSKSAQYKNLKNEFPDIFGPGYHLLCRGKAPPVVFTDKKSADQAAFQYGIEPMPFPVQNPEVWAVPSNTEYHYPNIVINTDPETNARYPYLPCFSNTEPERSSNYVALYKPDQEYTAVITTSHLFTTDKFLPPGGRGELDASFLQLLDLSSAVSFGVVYHPSNLSLIHCLLYAKSSEYFRKFVSVGAKDVIRTNNKERETIALMTRKKIANEIKPELLKQELYDYTIEEIKDALADRNSFFESKLFYRALEEYYDVNIFIFSNAPDNDGKRFPFLEIPRCCVYHTREKRLDRESLLLLKNYGPTLLLNLNRKPQYELIKTGNTVLYDRKVTELCYYILAESQNVLTWSFQADQSLKLYEGISFMHSFSQQLGPAILSQYIDAAGYTRIINFQHKKGKISMFVPPSQPLAVKTISTIPTEYMKLSEKDILEVFSELGRPSGCAEEDGMIVGLWFPYLGLQKGIYVPTKRFRGKYKVLSLNPYGELTKQESYTEKIIKVKETANFIKQIVIWLFDIYRTTVVAKQLLWVDFVQQYFALSSNGKSMYKFEDIREKLPRFESVEEGINYLATVTQNFIVKDKLYFNERLATKVGYFLSVYERRTVGLAIQPAEKIKDYFLFRKFHNINANTRIFLNQNSFLEWTREMLESRGKLPVVITSLKSDLVLNKLPFIIQIEDSYFLTQNVTDVGVAGRRFIQKTGSNWLMNRVNSDNHKTEKSYPVLAYYILKSRTAMPADFHGNVSQLTEGEPYLRTLRYGNALELTTGKWQQAILLPL